MYKFIVPFLLITLLQPWRLHGQIRGDSIFDSANVTTNRNPSAAPESAKTNSSSISRAGGVADGALIGFDKLAGFPFRLTDELVSNTNAAKANGEVNAMIPADIRALDRRSVSVEGFIVPIDFEKDKMIEFILVQAPFGCCYGVPPQIHELIKVRVKSPGISPMLDGPVRMRGILRVGAERENGYLSSIYRMDAETVTAKLQK
jgi:hypothetical protein